MERVPFIGLKAQSKTERCSGRSSGRALDRLALVDVGDDGIDLFGRVAELAQGRRDGLVDDLEEALADELLVLDQGDVRLDAGGVAIHHEGDGVVADEAVGHVGHVRGDRDVVGELLLAERDGGDLVVEVVEGLGQLGIRGPLEESGRGAA